MTRLRYAKFDAYSLMVCGALSSALSLACWSFISVFTSVMIGATGWAELKGVRMFAAGDMHGARRHLCGSQLVLIGALWLYCAVQLLFPSPMVFSDDMVAALRDNGLNPPAVAQFLRSIFRLAYILLIPIVGLYQGGMAVYYFSKTKPHAAVG